MINLDKLMQAAFKVYGEHWQSAIARDLGISDRTIRSFISNATRPPIDLSSRLLSALERKKALIQEAIDIVNSDKKSRADISNETITEIAKKYKFHNKQIYENAIREMNNAVSEITFLSDLEQIARNWASLPIIHRPQKDNNNPEE